MQFLFRVDASMHIGSGHIHRCAVLARYLKNRKHSITFACRQLPGNMLSWVKDEGFECIELKMPESITPSITPLISNEKHTLTHADWLAVSQTQDAQETIQQITIRKLHQLDWIITDHYGIDEHWHQLIRPYTQHIMAIDDLGNRSQGTDMLLDHNFLTENSTGRGIYQNKVPQACKVLLGPSYALIASDFFKYRREYPPPLTHKFLIFMGGADEHNISTKILHILSPFLSEKCQCDLLIGSSNPHRNDLLELAKERSWVKIINPVRSMAKLLTQYIFVVGTPGVSALERAAMGVPSISISIAQNQIRGGQSLQQANVSCYLGEWPLNSDQILVNAFSTLWGDSKLREQQTMNGRLVTPEASLGRVAQILENYP